MGSLETIGLSGLTVIGSYRRCENKDRSALISFSECIIQSLKRKSNARENYLICALPGSGKTFLIEQIAKALSGEVSFTHLDLSRDSKDAFEGQLNQIKAATLPVLCLIDEIDGRKGDDWPYDVIDKYLDLNEDPSRPPTVFVLIGSSGGTLAGLREAVKDRYKSKDLLDRISGRLEVLHHDSAYGSW